jgi:plastocyanin
MNIKYVIIGVIAAVLIIGGFATLQSQASSPSINSTTPTENNTQMNPSEGTTVEYTEQGFTPKTITVKVGTTVTWVNKDSDPMWVASNPHPIHTDLPGFDALKQIPTGETYSYTFTKVGNWGYHNHLNPSNTGTVVVEQ